MRRKVMDEEEKQNNVSVRFRAFIERLHDWPRSSLVGCAWCAIVLCLVCTAFSYLFSSYATWYDVVRSFHVLKKEEHNLYRRRSSQGNLYPSNNTSWNVIEKNIYINGHQNLEICHSNNKFKEKQKICRRSIKQIFRFLKDLKISF